MDPVVAWLLDPAEPAVRASALVHLGGRPQDDPDVVEARRESLARGSAARVLDGLPRAGDPYRPKYGAPFHRLVALAEMGVDASHPEVAALLESCLARYFADWDDQEVCLTGNLARSAILMGRGGDARVQRALRWLVDAQRPDGGWHCWPEEDPHGTIDAWEALGAFAAIPRAQRSAAIAASAARGVEFLLARNLGLDDPYEPWRRIHFPRHYYYDALVGLDLATSLGEPRDARLLPALAWLAGKRGSDGAWRLDASHPDIGADANYEMRAGEPVTPLVVEVPGEPSRWATLQALRVLGRVASPR